MKTVDRTWRNVARGLQEAERLEAKLAPWAPAIERARQGRHERSVQEWKERCEADTREHVQRLRAWQASESERRRDLARRHAMWEQERVRQRARLAERAGAARVVRSGSVALVAALAALVTTREPLLALMGGLVVLLMASGPAVQCMLTLLALGVREPSWSGDAPTPIRDAALARPEREPAFAVDLGLVAMWWRTVAHASRSQRSGGDSRKAAGEEGEELVARTIAACLPDDHVAIRRVQVKATLDADLVVVGPSGIWVFEVKHWTGTLERRGQLWSRVDSDGVREDKQFDRQWIDTRALIEKTLTRRLRDGASLGRLIRGGLVFSHPGVEFGPIDDSTVAWGQPGYWADIVTTTAPHPPLSRQSVVLGVIDALLTWDHRLVGETAGTLRCSVQAAQRLYDETLVQAQVYCTGQAG